MLLNAESQAGRSFLVTSATCSGEPTELSAAGVAEAEEVPAEVLTEVPRFWAVCLLLGGILHANEEVSHLI
jgi:hypothetical protein